MASQKYLSEAIEHVREMVSHRHLRDQTGLSDEAVQEIKLYLDTWVRPVLYLLHHASNGDKGCMAILKSRSASNFNETYVPYKDSECIVSGC